MIDRRTGRVAFGVSLTRLAMVACWNSLCGIYRRGYRRRYSVGRKQIGVMSPHHHQVSQRFVAVTVNQYGAASWRRVRPDDFVRTQRCRSVTM